MRRALLAPRNFRKVFVLVNKIFSALAPRLVAAVKAQSINIIFWSLVVLVTVAVVVANRSTKAATYAKLTSTDATVRQAEILRLADSVGLADALTDTEDPNSPATSPANVRSNAIREAAATELNNLISAGKISPPSVAMDNLFLLSKDADATVKSTADAGLAIVGSQSDANLVALVSRLADGDPDVRTAAATALGKIGGARAAELVAPLLKDSASSDAAGTALINIGTPSVKDLTPMLVGASPDLRVLIVNALGGIGDLSCVEPLLTQVNAQPPSPSVHRLAIVALSNVILKSVPEKIVGPVNGVAAVAAVPTAPLTPLQQQETAETLPVLTAALSSTAEDSFARARAALAVGRIGGPLATSTLVATLGDFDSRVAESAVTGLQEVGPQAVPDLSAATKSGNLVVRVAAASALGGIGDGTALAAIKHSLSDPAVEVRQAGATGLGISANPASTALLIPLLSDPSGEVASAASNSLHLLGTPAIPGLVATLGSSNQAAAFYASQALRQIGNSAEPAVTAVLTGTSESMQVWAAVTLGQIHDARALPALTALSQTGSSRARWAASQALFQLGQA
jgi:HEAT repeat protein